MKRLSKLKKWNYCHEYHQKLLSPSLRPHFIIIAIMKHFEFVYKKNYSIMKITDFIATTTRLVIKLVLFDCTGIITSWFIKSTECYQKQMQCCWMRIRCNPQILVAHGSSHDLFPFPFSPSFSSLSWCADSRSVV